MAVMRETPYSSYNFRLEIDGEESAAFSEVSGISAEMDVIHYRSGTDRSSTPQKLPGLVKIGSVTLKRGIAGSLFFSRWHREASQGQAGFKRTVRIVLMSEDRQIEAMEWILRNAWPQSYAAGPLLAATSHIAMEQLVLVCDDIEAL
jgi:phage tail-like protein